MTRTVAITKPHLWKGRFNWWCLRKGDCLGIGYTKEDAYRDWLARNGMAA